MMNIANQSVSSIQQATRKNYGPGAATPAADDQILAGVIETQREQITSLLSEKDRQEEILENLYKKISKQTEEIELLSRALEFKVGDAPDNQARRHADKNSHHWKAQYNRQQRRHADGGSKPNRYSSASPSRDLLTKIDGLKKKVARLTKENDDLKIVRELNNQELIEVEQKRHDFSLKNQQLERDLKLVNQEKTTLLDYVQELQNSHEEKVADLQQAVTLQESQNIRLQSNVNLLHEQLNKQAIEIQTISEQYSAQQVRLTNQQHEMDQIAADELQQLHLKTQTNSATPLDELTKAELVERIELLESQLEKGRLLADEQTQQMSWITDYYKEEIEQLKSQHNSQLTKANSKLSTSLQQVNILEQQILEMQNERNSLGQMMNKLKMSSATIGQQPAFHSANALPSGFVDGPSAQAIEGCIPSDQSRKRLQTQEEEKTEPNAQLPPHNPYKNPNRRGSQQSSIDRASGQDSQSHQRHEVLVVDQRLDESGFSQSSNAN